MQRFAVPPLLTLIVIPSVYVLVKGWGLTMNATRQLEISVVAD